MPTLEIFQPLWAMERRRPDGKEWSLDEKVEMIEWTLAGSCPEPGRHPTDGFVQ